MTPPLGNVWCDISHQREALFLIQGGQDQPASMAALHLPASPRYNFTSVAASFYSQLVVYHSQAGQGRF